MTTRFDPKTTPWQIQAADFPQAGTAREKLAFLLRYAILAPSSHNTQPWQFSIGDDGDHEIRVFVDKSRWLRVADEDQRELHISVGCALENLLIAAEHFGHGHQVSYFPEPGDETLAATVKFKSGGQPAPFRTGLFETIPLRRTNHKAYEDRPIPDSELARLESCLVEEGVELYPTTDMAIKRQVDEWIVEADARQFADSAWREELGYWIGQGVFGASWLMAKVGQLAVTYLNLSKNIAKQDSEVLMSAPVLAVLTTQADGRSAQVKAGQAFERLFLAAATQGIRLHPMNQILQLPDLKRQVAKLVPTSPAIPQIAFRLGYAEPEEEHTPRRSLEEVLV